MVADYIVEAYHLIELVKGSTMGIRRGDWGGGNKPRQRPQGVAYVGVV